MYRSGRTELAIAAVALAFVATLSAQGRQGEPGGAQGGRGGRGNVQLPDGDGRDTVNATCGGCHGLNMITGAAGYTQDGWRDLISTMVRLPRTAAGLDHSVPRGPLSAEAGTRAEAHSRRRHGNVP